MPLRLDAVGISDELPLCLGSSDGADIVQSSSAQVVAPCLQSGAKKSWLSTGYLKVMCILVSNEMFMVFSSYPAVSSHH